MLIQHKNVGKKGIFYVEQDGNILAEMVYSMATDSKMVIEHTEVSEELKGRGVGQELVKTGVDFARTHGLKIVSLCPFASAIFRKRAEYADVLAEN